MKFVVLITISITISHMHSLKTQSYIYICSYIHLALFQVDFWQPDYVKQVKPKMQVDFRVEADKVLEAEHLLKENKVDYEVLIDNLQTALHAQFDSKVRSTGHSYEKYNTWDKVKSKSFPLYQLDVLASIVKMAFDILPSIFPSPLLPCDSTYCGSTPESEKETKALADFIREHLSTIKAYLTIHSYSQLLLFPYSYTYALPKDYNELNTIASAATEQLASLYNTKYVYGPGATTIYPAAGGSDDWAYDQGIKYSFTFELRDTGNYGFLLPESQIKPTCEETLLAVKYIASYVLDHLY
uniref:Carboxypeptidase B n=1 Tax=Pavo cristatus TaxID=9049 RepID=A0A8C9L6E6_PAVCR